MYIENRAVCVFSLSGAHARARSFFSSSLFLGINRIYYMHGAADYYESYCTVQMFTKATCTGKYIMINNNRHYYYY